MKISIVFFALILTACGDLNVETPEKKDQTVKVEKDGSITTVENSKKKAAPSKSGADCGEDYKAKVVYEADGEVLYACINDAGESKEEETKTLEVLDGCPYTYELTGSGSVTLTYAAPNYDKNPAVSPSYVIKKGLNRDAVNLADSKSKNICTVYYWDGELLQYFDNSGRGYEIEIYE